MRNKRICVAMAVALALGTGLLGAARADVRVDSTFGVNGIVWTDFGPNQQDTPNDLLLQPDGKILAAGISTGAPGYFVAMARYSEEGVLDSAGFGVDGKVLVHWVLRDQANSLALQEDGKIVAAGMQMTSNAVSAQIPCLYRFLPDGAVDSTFADSGCVARRFDGVSSGEYATVVVRPDGKILAGGRSNANANGGTHGFGAKRFLPDGTQNLGMLKLASVIYRPGACAFLSDGRILWANISSDASREYLMTRVDSLGNYDTSFGSGAVLHTGITAVFNTVCRLVLLPDGKFLLGGTTPRDGGGSNMTVIRFHEDGSVDSSFGVLGRADVAFAAGTGSDVCRDIAVDGSGRILLAGEGVMANGRVGLARLLPDGTIDSTFSGDGRFDVDVNGPAGAHYLTRVRLLPGGKILGVGYDFSSRGGDFFLMRFSTSEATAVAASGARAPRPSVDAFPNPTRAGATIRFDLPRSAPVSVDVYDVAGRAVRRVYGGTLAPGSQSVVWDGRDDAGREAAPGVFFTKVSTPEGTRTAKLIRVR